MKRVTYTKEAAKILRKIPASEAKRIVGKINQYAIDPSFQRANVKKLKGGHSYRLRIGDWRVIFDENHSVLSVLKIGARGTIY